MINVILSPRKAVAVLVSAALVVSAPGPFAATALAQTIGRAAPAAGVGSGVIVPLRAPSFAPLSAPSLAAPTLLAPAPGALAAPALQALAAPLALRPAVPVAAAPAAAKPATVIAAARALHTELNATTRAGVPDLRAANPEGKPTLKERAQADLGALFAAVRTLAGSLVLPYTPSRVMTNLRALKTFFSSVIRLGWIAIAAVFTYYLIRDTILYILIPYLVFKGIF